MARLYFDNLWIVYVSWTTAKVRAPDVQLKAKYIESSQVYGCV